MSPILCTLNDMIIFFCLQLQLSQPLTAKQFQCFQSCELRAGPPLHQRLQVSVFTLPYIIWYKMNRACPPDVILCGGRWWCFSMWQHWWDLVSFFDARVSCSCTTCSSEQSAKAKTQKELFKTLKELKMHLPSEKRSKGKSSTINTLKYALRCVKQVKGKPSSDCSCVKIKTLD